MKIFFRLLSMILIGFILAGCGATSTGSRYEESKEKEKVEKETVAVEDVKEDFNLTPYRTEIKIDDPETETKPVEDIEPWYGYDKKDTASVETEKIIDTSPGFRVLVYTTDNLEKAKEIRSNIYFKTNEKNIYIDFEPPFHKVKVGDFKEISEATELSFKLNQLGFKEARVINDTINIFE